MVTERVRGDGSYDLDKTVGLVRVPSVVEIDGKVSPGTCRVEPQQYLEKTTRESNLM